MVSAITTRPPTSQPPQQDRLPGPPTGGECHVPDPTVPVRGLPNTDGLPLRRSNLISKLQPPQPPILTLTPIFNPLFFVKRLKRIQLTNGFKSSIVHNHFFESLQVFSLSSSGSPRPLSVRAGEGYLYIYI